MASESSWGQVGHLLGLFWGLPGVVGLCRVVWRHDWVSRWIQGFKLCPVWPGGLPVGCGSARGSPDGVLSQSGFRGEGLLLGGCQWW